MVKTYISILLIIVSIILMAMPSSLAMTFASGPDERGGSYYAVGKKTGTIFICSFDDEGKVYNITMPWYS